MTSQVYSLNTQKYLVRDSSAVQRLFVRLAGSNSGSAHFHVSWLSDFIFYPKPLYKFLHQSFFYSFITILPSESGVTLEYSTIFTQTLSYVQQVEQKAVGRQRNLGLKNTMTYDVSNPGPGLGQTQKKLKEKAQTMYAFYFNYLIYVIYNNKES